MKAERSHFAAPEEERAISTPIVSLEYKPPEAETKQPLECITHSVLKEPCK